MGGKGEKGMEVLGGAPEALCDKVTMDGSF